MADRRSLLALVTASSLAGCSFAPAYHPPVIPAPATFKEAGPWMPAAPGDLIVKGPWWSVFGDTTLDQLEQRLDSDNPTLAGALGRYDEARAYLAEARGGLFPTVGLDADITRNRQSDHRPLRGSNQPDLYPADTFGGEASYELDLWGRVRNSIAANKAEAEASADDLAAVKLSLEAQLATSYIALRGDDQQERLLSATVDAYAQADATTQRRFKGGIASGIDTGRSGAQLAEAQALLADIAASRALTEHAIASLVGTPASDFSVPSALSDLRLPDPPAALPSTLLERRPDVAAAERRMAAANADIGVAKAAFFPAISLGAAGGFQNTGLPGLFTAPNLFWSVGPSTVLTLFDGGRRRARVAIARANWTQTTADYRDRVLQAFQDVEDNLARLHHYGVEADAESRAVQQAGQTEALSLNRYVKGAVSYLDVVEAQTTALRTRQQALNLATLRLQASVNLIRALGGGWSSSPPRDARFPPNGTPGQAAPQSTSQVECPKEDTMMKPVICALLLGSSVAALPSAVAANTPEGALRFRDLEFEQPRDPLLSSNPVFSDVHHSSPNQLAGAVAALNQAIPAGTPRADAEQILRKAGAHCVQKGIADTDHCTFRDVETVQEYLDDILWTVDLHLAGEKVADLSVDRAWQRH